MATRSTTASHGGQAVGVPRVLVIDSYDSFVYNLVQYLGELGAEPIVVRNDAARPSTRRSRSSPMRVLLSPGPGRPEDAGILCAAIPAFADAACRCSVCVSATRRSATCTVRSIVRAPALMHGKTSPIEHDGDGVFAGLPSPLTATRYHTLVIDPATVPECLEVTAWTVDGTVMGVRHRNTPVEGVQFHPESILTAAGHDLLRNFLRQRHVERSRPEIAA